MKSVMSHQFSGVPTANIQRSTFDRSHGYKTTLDSGKLVPVFVDEALPGDTFDLNMNGFSRMATPIHPVMDNLFMETFFFAVPLRLVWDNFQKFMGEQKNPDDSTDFLIPTMTSPVDGYDIGSLSDYFGIPTGVDNLEHSALYHRAYNLIWNEWFRDENLQDSVSVPTNDGPDDPSLYSVLSRNKRHDYFTSSLPWPQKGEAVNLPLGTSAPITSSNALISSDYILRRADSSDSFSLAAPNSGDLSADVYADLTEATSATINDLRTSFTLQQFYERNARGGTRYTEIIQSHFSVYSDDSRLQRPEYLGGGSSAVQITPVQQTSSTDSTSPQGNLSGFGVAGFSGHRFRKSFTEHCIILGFVNVRADLTYQQGLDRMFSRSTKLDFYWPTFANLGEQAVLNKEIFAQGTDDDEDAFGYQERYAEYRYKNSKITGQFRSTAPLSLDAWHLSQEFDNLPVLGDTFITDLPPVDRVVAVPSQPQFLFDSYFNLKCHRPMPLYGVPGLSRF